MSYKLDISYLACIIFYDNKILYLTKSVFDDYDIIRDETFHTQILQFNLQ